MEKVADGPKPDSGPTATRRDPREDAWVRAAKNGDCRAFEGLVELHGRSVLRFLEGLSGPAGEAEDLSQETLFQAFRRIGTFLEGTDFRAWLLTIAYHVWVHAWRKKKPVVSLDHESVAGIAAPAHASDGAGGEELQAAIRAGLGRLPDDQRVVVLLRFGEGLSHAQIAALTDSEVATVRWRLFRARQTLRKILKAWAPTEKGSGV
ncbi:MAG: RNA polymerase sigma factor [Planctomycetota bacterium]|nr:RNA polymerase sigma factor [Planctomycetota bacterium]